MYNSKCAACHAKGGSGYTPATTGALNVEFSRHAVTEMKRDLDQMEQHHQEHLKMMSEQMRSQVGAMMKDMEAHRAKLKDAVAALENDLKADKPDAKKVAADSSDVIRHLDEMSAMQGKSKSGKMKM